MIQANRWLIGAVAAVAISTVALWEGKRNDPYEDLAGIQTVCYGETNVEMRRYSDAECKAMLAESIVKYGDGVLQCVSVPISQNTHSALSSFAYNVGVANFCKSTVARKLNSGDTVGACNSLMAWTYVKGKHVPGLANRRKVERDLCLKGCIQ